MRFFNPFSFWSVVPLASRTVTVSDKTGFSLTAGSYSPIRQIVPITISMGAGSTTSTATISPALTSVSKAVLCWYGSTGSANAQYAQVYLVITNTTTITWTRSQGTDAGTVTCAVLEFY